jgi:hypothetical protein
MSCYVMNLYQLPAALLQVEYAPYVPPANSTPPPVFTLAVLQETLAVPQYQQLVQQDSSGQQRLHVRALTQLQLTVGAEGGRAGGGYYYWGCP